MDEIKQHWVSNYHHINIYSGYYSRVGIGHSWGDGHLFGDVEILNQQGQPQISYLQLKWKLQLNV
jgi:hypothetical protein